MNMVFVVVVHLGGVWGFFDGHQKRNRLIVLIHILALVNFSFLSPESLGFL